MGDERDPTWLSRFHAGERSALEDCYREHFDAVEHTVGRLVRGADRDTLVHEVFYQLLARTELRANFTGGSLRAWLCTVARNLTLDHLRRARREREILAETGHVDAGAEPPLGTDEATHRQRVVAQFRSTLPEAWQQVFDARFVGHASQRDAAAALCLSRTTLLYREHRVRQALLRYTRSLEA